MMVVAMMTVPAMPTVMMPMPPTHFRRLGFGVLLNRRGAAGIDERNRIGAAGRNGKRKHGANGGEPQYFRELHECSPWVGTTSAPNRSPQRYVQAEARDLNES